MTSSLFATTAVHLLMSECGTESVSLCTYLESLQQVTGELHFHGSSVNSMCDCHVQSGLLVRAYRCAKWLPLRTLTSSYESANRRKYDAIAHGERNHPHALTVSVALSPDPFGPNDPRGGNSIQFVANRRYTQMSASRPSQDRADSTHSGCATIR